MTRVLMRVLERGRVTIPKGVREELDLEPGDRVWGDLEAYDESEEIPYSHADDVARLR